MRKFRQAELPQSGKKARKLLAPKRPKHHLGRDRRPGPGREHQDQSGQVGMIDELDRGECREVRGVCGFHLDRHIGVFRAIPVMRKLAINYSHSIVPGGFDVTS